ncbi:cysteine synthase A [Bauldia litoralis]|uniref:Cysteine synthase B n=1 Tax=Bauldia litoralis TaxID=665467 RepID=A0A1G6ECK8_9HYPH|nr:cysteine synthase A [Bauldia litoralis]SDB55131.1 cysteine synthase A [Bauldia litoralis]
MTGTYGSILETVGNTPVVRINKLAPEGIDLFVKLEAFNPMGSVKDRLALGVIEAAERDGSLKPGQTVIEATSGNTGIGLAMVCAQKGYPLVVTMAESFSVERRKLMRFLGARVILTPASEKGTGMLAKATELAEKHGWFLCRQFENEANADMHSRTTAPEILRDFEGRGLDYWVTGAGTAGTLKGVSRVLKKERPDIRIVVCEPDNSPIIGSGVAQDYAPDGTPARSHPYFRPHLMQGWTPDFIPKLANDALTAGLVDEVAPIQGADALKYAKELALKEGIFCGISGGATFAGALQIARKAPKGTTILCMLPDTGERYLSTPLFEDVSEDMTAEEMEIAASTPRYRFDVSAAATPPAASGDAASPEAVDFVETVVSSSEQPVVLFALEWCEFSWSLRKMFTEMNIPYRSVDLDSVEYQEGNRGGDIRSALREKISIPTIPQVFVGGQHVGGCTETLDAFNEGRLQELLSKSGVAFAQKQVNAYSYLPKWVHPR